MVAGASAAIAVGWRATVGTVQMEQRLGNAERRVDRIEQILPTLATRADLKVAIAPLATKAELRAAIAESERRMCDRMDATAERLREEMRDDMRAHVADTITASEQRVRTHFDVVAKSLRDDTRLVAEAVVALSERVDRVS